MKIMFSMPIHERPEVVLDTLCNLRAFHDDFGVVLHISNQFDYSSKYMKTDRFWETLKSFPNLYVNPRSFDTYWNGPGVNAVVNIHNSNFEYLQEMRVDYEYFVFMASNELYVKKGLYDFIKDYDFGNNYKNIIERPDWIQSNCARMDTMLSNILEKLGGMEIYGAQLEGSFYKKEIFAQIVETIRESTDDKILGGYAYEEIYYPTVCYYLFSDKNQYHANTTYMPWEKNLVIDMKDVNKCAGEGNFFSVKRINRIFDDDMRGYIRCEVGKYGTKNGLNLPWSSVKNNDIDESRYVLSNELIELEKQRIKGEKNVYDVLAYADRCVKNKDAEYLAELLLCDLWKESTRALRHLAGLGLKNSFITRLLMFEITNDIEIAEEEFLDQRKYLLLLRMLVRRKKLSEYSGLMKNIICRNFLHLILFEVFLRLERDDRLKFFCVKDGRDIWLHYNDERLKENNRTKIPLDDVGRKWPFDTSENHSPFAMYFGLASNGIYFSIEFCTENEEIYRNLLNIEKNSRIIDAGRFKILKFIDGIAPVTVEKNVDYNVNMILNIFADIGEKLLKRLVNQVDND